MDDRLKELEELMQKLGNAIQDTLSESDSVAKVIEELRVAGYSTFLLLEAIVESNESNHRDQTEILDHRPKHPQGSRGGSRMIEWTGNDRRFLRALNILPDDP